MSLKATVLYHPKLYTAAVNTYSSVPNRRVGWNKHVGGNMVPNIIIMLDGINMLVGICIFENEIDMLDGMSFKI